jgi:hypothetical protein
MRKMEKLSVVQNSRELNHEEALAELFGDIQEQNRLLVSCILNRFPGVTSGKVYQAVGSAIKKYGYRITAYSVNGLSNLTDYNIFAKLNYACSSYKTVADSERTVEQQKDTLKGFMEADKGVKKKEELRKMLSNVESSVLELFCKGVIPRSEYERVSGNKEASSELIRKVFSRDTE